MNRSHITLSLTFALTAFSIVAQAQHKHAVQHHGNTPYAGQQTRDIKALSEQHIADLRAGAGMSLALPAELNGYPGPAHVLQLADVLKLSAEQRSATEALYEQMLRDVKALGEDVITRERELDKLFSNKRATPENVAEATTRAALAQGRLRAAHLNYHLTMLTVLTSGQVANYNQQRGY